MARTLPDDGTFKNAFAKILRARNVLAEYRAEEQRVILHNTPRLRRVSASEYAFENAEQRPDVAYLSALAGDVIHNCRSALDQTASELARLNGEDDRHIHFPFAGSETDFPGQIAQKNFHLAGPEAVKLIHEFRPYKRGNIILRALHDFDLEDKHRSLISISIAVSSGEIHLGPAAAEFPIGSARNCPMAFNGPLDSALSGILMLKALEDIVELSESIVKAFAALHTLR